MNLLFITLSDIKEIDHSGIYTDLLREFRNHGHQIYVVSPTERKYKKNTYRIEKENCHILKVKTGNIQKTNVIEKGIATLLLESQYIHAIKKYFHDVTFDLVIYSTPPITIAKSVEYIKKRDRAKSYLLLKDIFPQNAVDMEMISKTGLKSILYRLFRKKETKLYALSDKIGCMSQANVDYVIKHNPEIDPDKVEICPNSVDVKDLSVSDVEKQNIRKKYEIPVDKKVFVYGGNLGKPQGIPFLMECLKQQANNPDVFFLIVGSGTEYGKIETYIKTEKPDNVRLMSRLPKEDYDCMVGSCDVGMIVLDHRFTIPNFPSRLLSYMQAKMPVFAITDPNTDIGTVIKDGNFGWWCESNDIHAFNQKVKEICETDTTRLKENAYTYLLEHYTVQKGYETISKHLK